MDLMKLPLAVLGIDSNYDPSTEAPYIYRDEEVYPNIRRPLYPVRLRGEDATRENVAESASRPNVRFITGVGHGFEDRFTGDSQGSVFQVGQYDQGEVKNKLVHFFACETAKRLGPDFMANGCSAYFGYDERLLYFTEETVGPEVKTIFACDAEIDLLLFQRKGAIEVFKRTRIKFDEEIDRLDSLGMETLAADLKWIRDSLRLLLAEPEATL